MSLAHGWLNSFGGVNQADLLVDSFSVIDHKVIVQEDKILNATATINFLQKLEDAYPIAAEFFNHP